MSHPMILREVSTLLHPENMLVKSPLLSRDPLGSLSFGDSLLSSVFPDFLGLQVFTLSLGKAAFLWQGQVKQDLRQNRQSPQILKHVFPPTFTLSSILPEGLYPEVPETLALLDYSQSPGSFGVSSLHKSSRGQET